MKNFVFAALVASTALVGAAHAATTISNVPTGGSIGSFGQPDSQTYGEVFTAPVTGILQSFTLSLDGGIGQLHGGVGTWNGTSTFNTGFGSPTNLYLSDDVASNGAQSFTFTPNVAVTAGQQYVAYLSVFGSTNVTGTTTMPLGTGSSAINYFVWNNGSDPVNNPSWNYFADFGNASFSATFSAAPEPATWTMMIVGFGLVGGAMRRRSDKAVFA